MDGMADCYERFLHGDAQAFARIVTENRAGLSRYLFSFVRDMELAEELTEDVFVKLWLKRPADRKRCSFKTWLYTIGRNMAIDRVRKQNRERSVPLDEIAEVSTGGNPPLERYEAEETKRALETALQSIPPAYAEALRLMYYEGFTEKEIAHILKKSVKSTYNVIYRAKKSLREELLKEGFRYEI